MRKRRGNLLISALFMAAFLFFLSVALVVTNREDIRYTLFTDHKMRCNLAADGMLEYALQIMRTTSNWEEKVAVPLQFASGASATWSVTPYLALPSGSSRFSLPSQQVTPSGLVLKAVASSGPFRSERSLLLEEFRLADSLATGGRKPHLFALLGQNLSVLTPEFRWEAVATIPADPPTLFNTFSAGGEALHYCTLDEGAQPPEIKDYMPQSVGGIIVPGAFSVSPIQIPRGQGLKRLKLNGDKWEWEQMPDPGEQLGTLIQAASGGGGSFPPGATLDWDVIAKTPSELTVDYGYFNGPKINWYSITGTAAAAHDGCYYAHGTHYYYSGFRYKNTQETPVEVKSQGTKATLFQEPCILKLDRGGKWTAIVDYLKVPDNPLEEPTIVSGPRPLPSTLLVNNNGHVYTRELGNANPLAWLQVSGTVLQNSSLSGSDYMFFYGAHPIDYKPRYGTLVQTACDELTQHDIARYMPAFIPGRNLNQAVGQYGLSDPRNVAMEEDPQLDIVFSTKKGTATSAGQDLFCIVQTHFSAQPNAKQRVEYKDGEGSLAHFNGKTWQILPAGLGKVLPGHSQHQGYLVPYLSGGRGPVGAQKLLLGSYPTERPLLRRYAPVARWGL